MRILLLVVSAAVVVGVAALVLLCELCIVLIVWTIRNVLGSSYSHSYAGDEYKEGGQKLVYGR